MGNALTIRNIEGIDNDASVVVADAGDSVRTVGPEATMDDFKEHRQDKPHNVPRASATMDGCNKQCQGKRQCAQLKSCAESCDAGMSTMGVHRPL